MENKRKFQISITEETDLNSMTFLVQNGNHFIRDTIGDIFSCEVHIG